MQTTIMNEEYAYFFKALPSMYNRIAPQVQWKQMENHLGENYLLDKHQGTPLMTYQMLKVRSMLRDVASRYGMYFGEMNACVARKYKTGRDYLGWHSINDSGVNHKYPIVIVNWGASRSFSWLNKETDEAGSLALHDGDVMVMLPGFQYKYMHSVLENKMVNSETISLTFRTVNIE